MHDPKLLIFDEPLSGLDVDSARLFKDLIASSPRGQGNPVYLPCARSRGAALRPRRRDRQGKILADAAPGELTTLMRLANLESAFAELVQQEDTKVVAQQLVDVMQVTNA